MKQVLYICTCVICFFTGMWTNGMQADSSVETLVESNDFKRELICAHQQYYVAVESLLDTLEVHYNWVDAYDYEPYYMAIERLDSLYGTQL